MDALRNLTTPVRAFVALKLGDQLESAVANFIDELRTPGDAVRWVPRRNLHLTLKFLGDAVAPDRLAILAHALHQIVRDLPALEIRASGSGAFPTLARPSVIWVGLHGDGLDTLAARVESAAVECGFARETRPWSPHLTIGRVRHPRSFRRTRAALERNLHRDFGTARIESITLFRSTLGGTASTYDELASFPLRG